MASEISKSWRLEGSQLFVPMYNTRFRKAGKVVLEKRRLFPGYIFIESDIEGTEFYITVKPFITRSEKALNLLRYGREYEGNYSFEMNQNEQQTLLRLYNNEHCVEMSQGFIVDNSVTITDGPLMGFESRIKKINRHKMEAVVQIEMMGAMRDITVGLEIVKKGSFL